MILKNIDSNNWVLSWFQNARRDVAFLGVQVFHSLGPAIENALSLNFRSASIALKVASLRVSLTLNMPDT